MASKIYYVFDTSLSEALTYSWTCWGVQDAFRDGEQRASRSIPLVPWVDIRVVSEKGSYPSRYHFKREKKRGIKSLQWPMIRETACLEYCTPGANYAERSLIFLEKKLIKKERKREKLWEYWISSCDNSGDNSLRECKMVI
jgi:hypothetical protein